MKLHSLIRQKARIRKSKRRGRGFGSGKGGHTIGKGTKGQKSRSGNSIPVGFEGGQIPLYKRLPHLGGFRNPTKKDTVAVTLNVFNSFKDKEVVTPKLLVENKILKKLPKYGIKILAKGKLKNKVELKGFMTSEGAKKRILEAGAKLI